MFISPRRNTVASSSKSSTSTISQVDISHDPTTANRVLIPSQVLPETCDIPVSTGLAKENGNPSSSTESTRQIIDSIKDIGKDSNSSSLDTGNHNGTSENHKNTNIYSEEIISENNSGTSSDKDNIDNAGEKIKGDYSGISSNNINNADKKIMSIENNTNASIAVEHASTDTLDKSLNQQSPLKITLKIPLKRGRRRAVNVPDVSSIVPEVSSSVPEGSGKVPEGSSSVPEGSESLPDTSKQTRTSSKRLKYKIETIPKNTKPVNRSTRG